MTTLLSVLITTALSTNPTPSLALTDCPPGNLWLQNLAELFAGSAQHHETRLATGTPAAPPATLRLLTDGTDGPTCRSLNAMVAEGGAIGPSDLGPWAYYQVGDRYLLVSGTAPSPQALTTGFDVLAVVDSAFRVLDVIAI